jgi:hypothetical protein
MLFYYPIIRLLIIYTTSENLAAGTGSSYDIATAIKSWTDEVCEYPKPKLYTCSKLTGLLLAQYDASNPQPSHFTQVVWKATTQVGCALQMCNGIFAASFGVSSHISFGVHTQF